MNYVIASLRDALAGFHKLRAGAAIPYKESNSFGKNFLEL